MNQIISAFKDEFNRFYEMLGQQIDSCTEELWVKKTCGYIYWQQVLHTLACVELFSLPNEDAPLLAKYNPQEVFLMKDAETPVSKQEMKRIYGDVRMTALAFIDSLNDENLCSPHANMTKALGKPLTNLNGLISLVRHMVYHIGSQDGALRENGLKGVY